MPWVGKSMDRKAALRRIKEQTLRSPRGVEVGSTIDYRCSFCGAMEKSPPFARGALVYGLPPGWVIVPVKDLNRDDDVACASCRNQTPGGPTGTGGGRT